MFIVRNIHSARHAEKEEKRRHCTLLDNFEKAIAVKVEKKYIDLNVGHRLWFVGAMAVFYLGPTAR